MNKINDKIIQKHGGGKIKNKKQHIQKRKTKKKKSKKKNKTYKKLKCSPKNGEALPYSCYTSNSLHTLKQIWNARHEDVKIMSNDPKIIWEQLKQYMGSSCNNEACWLKHQCIKKDIDASIWDDTFAPKSPETWKKKTKRMVVVS